MLSAIDGHAELNPDGTPGPGWKLDRTTEYKELIAANKVPYGRGRARLWAWNLPDPVPVHREPLWTPRPDLVAKYPAYEDKVYGVHFRVRTESKSTQDAFINAKLYETYPLIWTSGRQVEHQGGGAMTRSNPILAELQPDMYVEIHLRDANARGIRDGDMVWVSSPRGTEYGLKSAKTRVKARVTKGIRPGTVFMPFHWGGVFQGDSYTNRYPDGTAPLVVGDSANILAPPGWDATTQMQTTKSGMCEVSK
jgi:formate dehydrogenase major subunit